MRDWPNFDEYARRINWMLIETKLILILYHLFIYSLYKNWTYFLSQCEHDFWNESFKLHFDIIDIHDLLSVSNLYTEDDNVIIMWDFRLLKCSWQLKDCHMLNASAALTEQDKIDLILHIYNSFSHALLTIITQTFHKRIKLLKTIQQRVLLSCMQNVY